MLGRKQNNNIQHLQLLFSHGLVGSAQYNTRGYTYVSRLRLARPVAYTHRLCARGAASLSLSCIYALSSRLYTLSLSVYYIYTHIHIFVLFLLCTWLFRRLCICMCCIYVCICRFRSRSDRMRSRCTRLSVCAAPLEVRYAVGASLSLSLCVPPTRWGRKICCRERERACTSVLSLSLSLSVYPDFLFVVFLECVCSRRVFYMVGMRLSCCRGRD